MNRIADSLRPPVMTRRRVALSLAVALIADLLQLAAGPFGWVFLDQAVDAVAMVFTIGLLGFHVLLLPTFLIELVPGAGMFPTWTACVMAVIALRRRSQPEPPRREPKPIVPDSERTISGSES